MKEAIYRKALYYFRTGTDGKDIDRKAMYYAIEALEKQIPKELVHRDNRIAYCPRCKDDLGRIVTVRFCPNCGQAIDRK